MKFANSAKRGGNSILAGKILSEAMPWIKEITGDGERRLAQGGHGRRADAQDARR